MLIVRFYRVMCDLVVETSATVEHDPMGAPVTPQGVFLGREWFDVSGSLNTGDLSEAAHRVLARAEPGVAEQFAGWHGLV